MTNCYLTMTTVQWVQVKSDIGGEKSYFPHAHSKWWFECFSIVKEKALISLCIFGRCHKKIDRRREREKYLCRILYTRIYI